MNVIFKPKAKETLKNITEFVDDMNTAGAGERWAEKLVEHIYKIAKLENLKFPLCNNESFANKGFSCIIYKGGGKFLKLRKEILLSIRDNS